MQCHPCLSLCYWLCKVKLGAMWSVHRSDAAPAEPDHQSYAIETHARMTASCAREKSVLIRRNSSCSASQYQCACRQPIHSRSRWRSNRHRNRSSWQLAWVAPRTQCDRPEDDPSCQCCCQRSESWLCDQDSPQHSSCAMPALLNCLPYRSSPACRPPTD